MTHRIQFTSLVTQDPDPEFPTRPARLTVTIQTVTGPLLGDLGVLVYRVDPLTRVERYSHVASPVDLQELNLGVVGIDTAFVRRQSVDLYLATSSLAREALSTIRQHLTELCLDLDALNVPNTPTVETVP